MLKHKKIFISLAIIIPILFGFIGFFQSHYLTPIVMYHSISRQPDPKNRLALSVESFRRQMQFLKKYHYNVISLEDLAKLIKDKKNIPPKTIVITFDDGYKDNYTYAFPILKEYNLPATVFLIIEEVSRSQNDRLSWEEIKIMQESGVINFGSHCLGPEPLVNIKSKEEVKRQIFLSKKILEEKLGQKINVFSYPEGRFNEQIRQLVIQAGYAAAVTTNPGKNFSDDDIFALKRLRISSTSDNLFVFWFETTGYYNFFRERRHK